MTYHDLWIDPGNPARMIVSDDGGAVVIGQRRRDLDAADDIPQRSCTASKPPPTSRITWSRCQQDNTSVAVPSTRDETMHLPGQPVGADYYEVGGGESGWVAPHPAKPDIFFAGSTNVLTRFDRRTGEDRDVQPWPRIVMGEPARDMPERWNWTYPVVFSPIAPHDLYAASQHVWRSRDEGATWERISGDLTRADPETLGETGGPIMLDQDGPEVYGTVVIIAPSRRERDTVWSGSDDGLVQVTRNGGGHWANVTPPDLPAFSRITSIDPSPHAPGRAYVSAKRNQLGRAPADRVSHRGLRRARGRAWTPGWTPRDFVHVDSRGSDSQPGLLYAGTEHGVCVSFDDGRRWQSLRLNLPDVQVADLKVERDDLVIATHGRSLLRPRSHRAAAAVDPAIAAKPAHLFAPAGVYRRVYPGADRSAGVTRTPAVGVTRDPRSGRARVVRQLPLPTPLVAGHHRIEWNLRTRGATVFPGMVLEAPNPPSGVLVPPGEYQVRLTVDGMVQTARFIVQADPRLTAYRGRLSCPVRPGPAAPRRDQCRQRGGPQDPAHEGGARRGGGHGAADSLARLSRDRGRACTR